MNRLEGAILYLLSRAELAGKDNLSKIELHKLLYLLEVESYRYTGRSFFDAQVSFIRETNGPISVDIYNALRSLQDQGAIVVLESQKEDYGFPRHGISLTGAFDGEFLTDSEVFFVNSVVNSYIDLPIKQLKAQVYGTEPMQEMIKQEYDHKVELLKGRKINFDSVPLDEDMVDLIAA